MDGLSCAVCSIPCTQSCGKCKNVSYCSKEHQSKDWKEHKKDCHPFKIGTHPEKGRVLLATKDMAPYSIIIQEQSIINLPNDEDGKLQGKLCVSCCKVSENLQSCSKCLAPVCGTDCELAEIHGNYECKMFPSGSSYRKATSISKLMAIIRCLLLKSRDKKKYDALMTLQSNLDHFLADKDAAKRYLYNSATVELILKDVGLHDYGQEEISTVIGIIDTNSLVSTAKDGAGNGRSSLHLYAKTSVASHSCVPNARPVIENSGRVKLIATRPIVAGEEITNPYTGLNEGTVERQKKLRAGYYFSCKCIRCEDPTELGTNFSSVKCRECTDGYLLPKYQWDCKQDLETEEVWMCSSCSNKTTDAEIQKLLAILNKEVAEIYMKSRFTNEVGTVAAFQALTDKYSGNILHPNHYLLFRLEHNVTEMMKNFINLEEHSKINLSRQEIFFLKETLVAKCRNLLKMFPGPSEIRGQMLYMCWRGMPEHKVLKERRAILDFIKENMAVAEEAVKILSLKDGNQVLIKDLNEWFDRVRPHLS